MHATQLQIVRIPISSPGGAIQLLRQHQHKHEIMYHYCQLSSTLLEVVTAPGAALAVAAACSTHAVMSAWHTNNSIPNSTLSQHQLHQLHLQKQYKQLICWPMIWWSQ
jgi:hypothetical protein